MGLRCPKAAQKILETLPIISAENEADARINGAIRSRYELGKKTKNVLYRKRM